MKNKYIYVIVWNDLDNGDSMFGASSLFTTRELAIKELEKIASAEIEEFEDSDFEIRQSEEYFKIQFDYNSYKDYNIEDNKIILTSWFIEGDYSGERINGTKNKLKKMK